MLEYFLIFELFNTVGEGFLCSKGWCAQGWVWERNSELPDSFTSRRGGKEYEEKASVLPKNDGCDCSLMFTVQTFGLVLV